MAVSDSTYVLHRESTYATLNKYLVLPLNDPDNVDKRRAEVGLSSLAEYLNHWNIKWDVEEYKKELPQIIEECKKYFGK